MAITASSPDAFFDGEDFASVSARVPGHRRHHR